jgi:O-antigen/teichoic acid export membrane protein
MLLGVFSGIIFSLYFNKEILSEKEKEVKFEDIYNMSIPYFVVMLVILLFFSLDIILAKRFFSDELAGKYAVLSMLGKMIYLGTFAISKAMFPLTSERKDNHQDSSGLYKKSLILISIICLISVIICAIFPKLIIGILYGNAYIDMAPFLVYSAIALSFLSLSNLVLIYGLSTDKLRTCYYLLIFLVIELVLLFMFHSSIKEYIISFMVSNIIMFIGSFFFLKKQ